MRIQDFYSKVDKGLLLLDGATGTNLQTQGMPTGICPEAWILEHPEVLIKLQKEFVAAGSDIIYAPTFSANEIKLLNYGLEDKVIEMNYQLVKLSKEAAGNKAFVAGNLTMTGEALEPVGTLTFERLKNVYKNQAKAQLEAGVDMFVIETMMSLQECRAAVIGIREISNLPILVTLTFTDSGFTFYGTSPESAVITLQSLGANAIGANCSTGPKEMVDIIRRMVSVAKVPIIAKPNAGLPIELEDGFGYDMDVSTFIKETSLLIEAGARIIGGCCGTTPEYMKALSDYRQSIELEPLVYSKEEYICSEARHQLISSKMPLSIIGERINPTGKKTLQNELKNQQFSLVKDFAMTQEAAGAKVLDINVGMNGIDEKSTLKQAVEEVKSVTSLPLCLDSSDYLAMEEALIHYPGRALVNSISLESDKLNSMLPLVAKYGAMVIGLPLSNKGLPKDIKERKENIDQLVKELEAVGLSKSSLVIDGLVSTIGANPKAGKETLETIRYCQNLEIATTVGLSNISFGLPNRIQINSLFLAQLQGAGLNLAIANPNTEMIMNTVLTTNLLTHHCIEEYLAKASQLNYIDESKSKFSTEVPTEEKYSQLFEDVLKGNRREIEEHTQNVLASGKKAKEILNQDLLPAINRVGDLFEEKKYFLPQLIASAESMEKSIAILTPLLQEEGSQEKKETIVIATVEGDIHDIGKNLVALMLRNYGYNVIDLGKDVPADKIIKTALENKASVIALSALMTTTMREMEKVVKKANEVGLRTMIMIGGAVITQSYADEIGAEGYSKDAKEAVEVLEALLKGRQVL